MQETLLKFVNDDLCEASLALLDKLGMKYTRGAEEAVEIDDLFGGKTLSKAASEALDQVFATYFVALIDDRTFNKSRTNVSLESALADAKNEKYNGLFVFAVDVKQDANITRTVAATLTRSFNRLAVDKPVVLLIRQSETLSIATCERSNYAQTWREGEKIGKVSMLRRVNCEKPHPGHVNTLIMLQAPSSCYSFTLLYEHWKEVFSTELLTKRFYNELSDWYAWAIQVMRFPNHLNNEKDNKKYNAENGIRLVTRLIFVWFLKQKKLVPDEFFDQNSLRQIIKDFDPTQKEHSLFCYMSKGSKYYKAILQNLFFAMLNCPLTEEGKKEVNVRKFRKYNEEGKPTGSNRGDSKLMRYKYYFKNPDAFVEMANRVPFLNGGLFDCLDDPDQSLYFDGFSDNEKVGKALCVPDYLFFGERDDINLSEWYDDDHKGHVKVRGIIDILKSYQFTIEENTPYEQEVSLDPELLGKVFENLLASYNPETNKTARKSTGSYYTPREIVQYMVGESLVAYLKEKVGEDLEVQYRQLLDYSETEIKLEPEQKQQIMLALYQCKVLDPACGSGAFPMGMLQQMVHILSQLDPDNTSWKKLVMEKSGNELRKSLDYKEEERNELQADINRSFDLGQNNPDYARKLYLIENCIYGVDIQTIAIQISKLRCFITLVVDQKVSSDPTDNFGIRPLPNLEARFVAANTLIGLGKDLSLANTESVQLIKDNLKEANHRIFTAKTMRTKRKWRDEVKELRKALSDELLNTGMLSNDDAALITLWDMFDQNTSSAFFDQDWMFGISNGFDIVIGNPPYIKELGNEGIFSPVNKSPFGKKYHEGKMDYWYYFLHKAIDITNKNGIICFITSRYWINSVGASKLIEHVEKSTSFINILDIGQLKVFENVAGYHMAYVLTKNKLRNQCMYYAISDSVANLQKNDFTTKKEILRENLFVNHEIVLGNRKQSSTSIVLDDICIVSQGIVEASDKISAKMYKKNPLPNYVVGQGIFVLSTEELKALQLTKTEQEILELYEDTGCLNRYYIDYSQTRWLIYSNRVNREKIKRNPSFKKLKSHLDKMAPYITSTYKPYGLHRSRTYSNFAQHKIIGPSMFVDPCFSYDERKLFVGMSYNIIIERGNTNLLFVLGLINSHYATDWFYENAKHRGAGVDVGVDKLRTFPIPETNDNQQQPIINMVDQIIKEKQKDPQTDTTTLERKIDILVYLLYGLTWDEVQIVENSLL